MAGFFVPKRRKQMPLYAYGTMPETPPEPVTETQHEATETNESEDDN